MQVKDCPEEDVNSEHVTADDRNQVKDVVSVALDKDSVRTHVDKASNISRLCGRVRRNRVANNELEAVSLLGEQQVLDTRRVHLGHCRRKLDAILGVDLGVGDPRLLLHELTALASKVEHVAVVHEHKVKLGQLGFSGSRRHWTRLGLGRNAGTDLEEDLLIVVVSAGWVAVDARKGCKRRIRADRGLVKTPHWLPVAKELLARCTAFAGRVEVFVDLVPSALIDRDLLCRDDTVLLLCDPDREIEHLCDICKRGLTLCKLVIVLIILQTERDLDSAERVSVAVKEVSLRGHQCPELVVAVAVLDDGSQCQDNSRYDNEQRHYAADRRRDSRLATDREAGNGLAEEVEFLN